MQVGGFIPAPVAESGGSSGGTPSVAIAAESEFFFLKGTVTGVLSGNNILRNQTYAVNTLPRGGINVNTGSSEKIMSLRFDRTPYSTLTGTRYILKLHLIHDGGNNTGFTNINVQTNTSTVYDSSLIPLQQANGNIGMVPLNDGTTSGDLIHTEIMFFYNNSTEKTFNSIVLPMSFTQNINVYGGSYIELRPIEVTGVSALN